jgi:hypothetical protein
MIRALYRRLSNMLSEERRRACNRLYYEDTQSIQESIGRPLTGRELSVLWEMDENQIYTIKKWLKEAKQ